MYEAIKDHMRQCNVPGLKPPMPIGAASQLPGQLAGGRRGESGGDGGGGGGGGVDRSDSPPTGGGGSGGAPFPFDRSPRISPLNPFSPSLRGMQGPVGPDVSPPQMKGGGIGPGVGDGLTLGAAAAAVSGTSN